MPQAARLRVVTRPGQVRLEYRRKGGSAEDADAVGAFDPLARGSLKPGDADRPGAAFGVCRQQAAPPLVGAGFPQASQGMKTAFRQLPRQSFRKSKMLYELVLMTGTSLIFRRFNTHRSKEKVLKNSVNFL